MKHQLDKYDCRLIQAFKSLNVSIDDIKQVWAERCSMELEYVHLEYINSYLLNLAQKLGLLDKGYKFSEFIYALNPKDNWKFMSRSRQYITDEEKDFNIILLSRLDSLFALTEVKYLPGYEEFLKS